MKRLMMVCASWVFMLSWTACVDIPITADNLLPVGTPFVVQGTATVVDNDGACLVWIGENGVTYHLFQGPLLDNDLFDQITTPGVTSRLVLVTRSDLEVTCQMGTIVEVREVLEILNRE